MCSMTLVVVQFARDASINFVHPLGLQLRANQVRWGKGLAIDNSGIDTQAGSIIHTRYRSACDCTTKKVQT